MGPYVLIFFMLGGFSNPGPVEFYGKQACELAASNIMEHHPTVASVECYPKSAVTTKGS